MRSLSSITRTQWLVIIGLELAAVFVYLVVIPWVVLSLDSVAPVAVDPPTEPAISEALPASTPTLAARPTTRPTVTLPSPTSTPAPVETSAPVTPTAKPPPAKIAPSAFADLVMNPRAMLASKTTFFTSACFGKDANLLQDRDYMAPADWSSSPDRKCVFGYNVNPIDRLPTGRYSVSGGPDGQPRFYLIPPEAFAKDTQSIKTLSQVKIIVDPDSGCESLGFIGITADGLSYQTPACAFLKAGGVCPIGDGSRMLVLPTNANNILDPGTSGGAYGFLGFPVVIFKKGFSIYFTGRGGYAPPRTWFESVVDTLAPNVNVKATAEMADQEVKQVAAEFDRLQSGADPMKQLAPLEREAQVISPSPVSVKSRQEGVISFAMTPRTVLSSIAWKITPLNNVDKRDFLETNLCLDMNGEEICFTGVEDFAHCAFFTPCITGYSRLDPVEHGGYVATRYFPAGTAPILRDGRVTARFQAPDTGAVLEIEVKVRVRDADPTLAAQP